MNILEETKSILFRWVQEMHFLDKLNRFQAKKTLSPHSKIYSPHLTLPYLHSWTMASDELPSRTRWQLVQKIRRKYSPKNEVEEKKLEEHSEVRDLVIIKESHQPFDI
ncbi:hypothetical protein CEXT_526591 [Caerostris extrusa]|uniref:Uncharacterized protein n=1 Tax=Caerostris extrusa TaxID=172846 RepID=A0AAV4Q0Q9_CAEEX|nr:hypothetical protein CEXT_526591 [Caerostris extrusa]